MCVRMCNCVWCTLVCVCVCVCACVRARVRAYVRVCVRVSAWMHLHARAYMDEIVAFEKHLLKLQRVRVLFQVVLH